MPEILIALFQNICTISMALNFSIFNGAISMNNLYVGWIGIFLGCIAGAVQGLFFHKEQWLGGYASWQRRMTRLGHISFFGIGFINIAYALSIKFSGLKNPELASLLLIVATISMPILCYLSAFKRVFRHLFFIPALSVITALGIFLWKVLQ